MLLLSTNAFIERGLKIDLRKKKAVRMTLPDGARMVCTLDGIRKLHRGAIAKTVGTTATARAACHATPGSRPR